MRNLHQRRRHSIVYAFAMSNIPKTFQAFSLGDTPGAVNILCEWHLATTFRHSKAAPAEHIQSTFCVSGILPRLLATESRSLKAIFPK